MAAKSDAAPKKGRCHQFSSFSIISSHKTDFQTGFSNRMVARHIQGHSVILFWLKTWRIGSEMGQHHDDVTLPLFTNNHHNTISNDTSEVHRYNWCTPTKCMALLLYKNCDIGPLRQTFPRVWQYSDFRSTFWSADTIWGSEDFQEYTTCRFRITLLPCEKTTSRGWLLTWILHVFLF
jgi:hypothetical protein